MLTQGVGKRVVVLFAVVVLVIVAHNLVVFHYFERTQTYGAFVELASRQQFLAQRLGALVQRQRDAGEVRFLDAMESTMTSFDEALGVLERGGQTLGRTYPAAPHELSGHVRAQRDVWNTLAPRLRRHGASGGARSPREIAETERLVEELATSSFGLVDGIEAWRRKLRRDLLSSIIGTSVIALSMLIVAFRLAWSKIVMPVRELRDEALRVSEHGAPSNPGDELGVVSTVVNEMSENVGRLRDERTRVERRLRRIEADYQFVFDNAVAGIFQFNAAGEVILANPATARILGYRTPAELAYSVKNVHETMFADPDHESRVKALVAEEETIKSETKMIRKDGRELWVLESSAIVHRTTNNYCCESVVVDITEMKKAQEQLRELSGLLLDSQERERRRIARELHDSTGQVLAALEMNLGRLRDFLEGAHDSLSATGELATQCSREIRSMSYLLHPPLLDELGLAYAVRDYAEGFSARSGIDVALELPEHLERLSQDMETALFRVIQEALTNIHRHAKSPAARIRLGVCSRSVMVEIEDDGCGIPPELLSSDNHSLSGMGVGMRGMEERLHQLGGRLTIVSSGDGTRVRGELPRRCRDDGDAAARAAVDASPHGPTPLSS